MVMFEKSRLDALIRDRRRTPRRAVSRTARIQVEGPEPDREVLVTDISEGGLRLFVGRLEIPERFHLIFEDTRERRECRLVWRIGAELGAEFVFEGKHHTTRRS
jgi:hypothetical protein